MTNILPTYIKYLLLVTLMFVCLSTSLIAQSPEAISYQAVIRDAENALVADKNVGMRISILQGNEKGEQVYSETHSVKTNAQGLVSITIGEGLSSRGGLERIDWTKGPYFIKTETDPEGGTNYSITGVSQIMTVPYALHAKTADNGIKPGDTPGEMQYWNGTTWVTVAAGNEGQVLTFSGGVPTWSTIVVWNDLTNPNTGKIWIDRNLGANRVAKSSNDEAAYGDLYQWGRDTDGHQLRNSATTTNLSSNDTPGHGDFIVVPEHPFDWQSPQNTNLWQGVDGTNNPCPSGYRLPTEAEWEAERISWSSNNSVGAFASPLKLPAAGSRSTISDGSTFNLGSSGYYWTSNVVGFISRPLYFHSTNAVIGSFYRANGFSVRCIKD